MPDLTVNASTLRRAHRLIRSLSDALALSSAQSMFPDASARFADIGGRTLDQGITIEEARDCLRLAPPVASHFAQYGHAWTMRHLHLLMPRFGFEVRIQEWPPSITLVEARLSGFHLTPSVP